MTKPGFHFRSTADPDPATPDKVRNAHKSRPAFPSRREFLGAAMISLIAAARTSRGAALDERPLAEVSRLIQAKVDDNTLHAASLRVETDSFVYARSFGPGIRTDAVFLLASITKPMTVAGVMLLADRGELRLNDEVVKFIPEFNEGPRRNITIKQLLTHTSGLPDQLPENSRLRQSHAPLSEFVNHAIRTPLLFEPGTRYSYQSMGILLAAEIVQRITGKSLADFLAREVFAPLGMTRSALGLGRFKLDEVVRSQTAFAAPESGSGASLARDWDWNSQYWRALGAPWGGAHGTAGDTSRFLRSFLHPDESILRAETARLMIQNHNQELSRRRGLGFDLSPETFGRNCSPQTFGHSGSTGTLAWADPKSGLSFVLLTSLPARVSRESILSPVSDLASTAQAI